MKLTFNWSDDAGEGNPSPTDRKRLLDAAAEGDVAAIDFAKDIACDAQRLYAEAMVAWRDHYASIRPSPPKGG